MCNFAAMDRLIYEGQDLDVAQLIALASAPFDLAPSVWKQIEDNRAAMDALLAASDKRYYGINTGFGNLYSVGVSPSDLQKLQTNLLRSHACGLGPAAPQVIVQLTLVLKILSLSKGYSGVRREVIQLMIDFMHHRIIPVVPTIGSLGASGDLAPLAHLCLPLIGEGEVTYKREQMPAAKALAMAGLDAITLEAKEGLALINGTQYSLAWLIHSLHHAEAMASIADMCAALSVDGFDGNASPFDSVIHDIRKQHGQITSAATIRSWLENSQIHAQAKTHLQDPYSFRCAPQVHGASRDVVDYATMIAGREINAVTDNPLVISDGETRIVSGGNFHAQPLALTSDFLSMAVAELGSISERRSYLLLSGQRNLPFALATNPGLESGMMICQYTGAALVNRNKILSHPASTDSIVTSAGQEDHVSMAANAGMKLYEIVTNTWQLLAIEWMIAAQAIEYRRPMRTSEKLEDVLSAYRKRVAPLKGDRSHTADIENTAGFLRELSL
jgi:histidine ammonia-lyase